MNNSPAISIRGVVLYPGDEGYREASTVAQRTGAPVLVVLPANADDVAEAVRYARTEGLALSVRSGGHSASGHSTNDGGMVINLSPLNSIEVDSSGLVHVGGGAVWGDIARELSRHSLAISSGDTISVGVGGLTLGGGVEWMVRKHGLALDSLVAAEVVTAAGDVVTASADSHPELFWALRGGGGNFGVVTRFTFQGSPLGQVIGGSITFEADALHSTLTGWRDVMRTAPEELTVTLVAMPAFGPFPAGVNLLVCYADADEPAAARAVEPLLQLPGLVGSDLKLMDYPDLLDEPHPPEGPFAVVDHNGFASELTDTLIANLVSYDHSLETSVLMLRSLGGAYGRVPVENTAFAHRDAEALVISIAFIPEGTGDARQHVDQAWQPVAAQLTGTYSAFTSNSDDDVISLMYPPATRERLGRVKAVYDPANLFNQNLNIRPLAG